MIRVVDGPGGLIWYACAFRVVDDVIHASVGVHGPGLPPVCDTYSADVHSPEECAAVYDDINNARKVWGISWQNLLMERLATPKLF